MLSLIILIVKKNEVVPHNFMIIKNNCVKMNAQKSISKQDRMLSPLLAAVLRIRENTDNQCPDDILRRIESLKIGKVVYHFKAGVSNAQPIPHSSSNGSLSGWRGSRGAGFHSSNSNNSNNSNNSQQVNHNQNSGNPNSPNNLRGSGSANSLAESDSPGFRQSSSWERPLSIRRVPSDNRVSQEYSSPREQSDNSYRRYRGTPPTPSDAPNVSYPAGGRYVSSIVSEKNVEDRIIGHIRSKLNKFSYNNYDSVKSFLEQIMNSGETEFISEFMDLLFAKAGSEEIYCELYARLLSELTEKFPHLVKEVATIYSNYISIFQEARNIPDQGTADYTKFLEAQLRKKFRYGYSHFLAEIYNKNLLPSDAIEITIKAILESLNKLEGDSTNTLLVEEYLSSLLKIITTINVVKSAPYPPYIVNMIDSLKKILDKPTVNTAGYTIKSRFKIMDIVEALPN